VVFEGEEGEKQGGCVLAGRRNHFVDASKMVNLVKRVRKGFSIKLFSTFEFRLPLINYILYDCRSNQVLYYSAI